MAGFFGSLIALALVAVAIVILALPATWMLMLFLGNVGLTGVGFAGALPGGILLSAVVGGGAVSASS